MPLRTLPSRLLGTISARRRERYRRRDELAAVDPAEEPRTYAIELSSKEFVWATTQALSFALFRTYAVPSIGELLYKTVQFTEETQKRYDDTVLLLSAPVEHGFAPGGQGHAAVRRINQMHGRYDISNDDMRYVLATFVVCPPRWINAYEWRTLSQREIDGLTNYYRLLGKHMGIKDIPDTYAEFESLMDSYERQHFDFREGSRAVADSTLDLLTTFMPYRLLPAPLVRRLARALMDEPLLDAFGYPHPTRAERVLVTAGLKARGLAIRYFATPRTEPVFGIDTAEVRGYPNGYRVDDLGTFPTGCPVAHKSSA
ncbi:oxygenase MpaB family protein [Gordonia sp. 852002-10350_SCH5691597]|uniref:oxygenase MpaB family protein n=1 Tax=Gordonia sp. 852002-10350_SCH5691597 TaxID=1834085 RepID=UPI0007EAC0AE|nr:oxygenase MpaB family protein [Gordonia sp. 852002-10350_SCH5691597]OBA74629.1 L-aspartate oxidase [Gordonia sp. 852002-10350_SCH5691597]